MMDSIAFRTLERPRSPNTYLVAPEGVCGHSEPDKELGSLPYTPDDLFAALIRLIEGQKGWSVAESDSERRLIHAIVTSRLMRYKDDVDFLVLPMETIDPDDGKHARLAIYSRSRIGHSDLGANRKRVNFILDCLDKGHTLT